MEHQFYRSTTRLIFRQKREYTRRVHAPVIEKIEKRIKRTTAVRYRERRIEKAEQKGKNAQASFMHKQARYKHQSLRKIEENRIEKAL